MHCHLRPPVPPVVLGFKYKAHNAPVYQISAKTDNNLTNIHGPFLRAPNEPPILRDELTELGPYEFRASHGQSSLLALPEFVLDFRYVVPFRISGATQRRTEV